MQKMLSFVRRAVDHYHMIEEGDRIAVGVSGGQESRTLLAALAELRRGGPHRSGVGARPGGQLPKECPQHFRAFLFQQPGDNLGFVVVRNVE